jgi:hypothetical protein
MRLEKDDTIIVPVEKRITAHGTETIAGVIGENDEAITKTIKAIETSGIGRSLGKTQKLTDFLDSSKGHSFGISNWDNCGWQPEGMWKKRGQNPGPENAAKN